MFPHAIMSSESSSFQPVLPGAHKPYSYFMGPAISTLLVKPSRAARNTGLKMFKMAEEKLGLEVHILMSGAAKMLKARLKMRPTRL